MVDHDIPNLQQVLEGLHVKDYDLSLLTRNLESTELTKVAARASLGRVVLATADIGVGCVLFRESPMIVWNIGDWRSFLAAVEELPEASHRGLLDMFHPPLDTATMRPFKPLSVHLTRICALDANTIHKLIAIATTNAHEYIGTSSLEYKEIRNPNEENGKKAALFLYGSKVSHSCQPNTSYSSQTQDGKLEYRAIRPIAAGEIVTFSYLDELFQTPTHVRRATLLQLKAFLCNCRRCRGPDFTRQIRCPHKACSQFVRCTNNLGSTVTRWSCDSCGVIQGQCRDKMEERETAAKGIIEKIEQAVTANCMCYSKSQVEDLVDQMSRALGPLHYLTLRAMEIHVRLCASQAGDLEILPSARPAPTLVRLMNLKFGTAKDLRLASAIMGLRQAYACECIAAGCSGTECFVESGNSPHPPILESSQTVFFASQDLIRCNQIWPDYAIRMVERYLPMMRILYGDSDSEVAQIAEMVSAMRH